MCKTAYKKAVKAISLLSLVTLLVIQSLYLPYLLLSKYAPQASLTQLLKDRGEPPAARAAWEYEATAQNIVTANGTSGNYINTRTSDGDYFRALTTTSGLDVRFTFDEVKLWNANRLVVLYDGTADNAALAYQIQIYDYAAKTWRNIIPHDTTYTNVADNATSGYTLAVGTTGALSGGFFEIYDGYFTNGSNSPISTPLGNFVDVNGQAMVRFYSTASTANYQLSIDLLTVRAAFTPTFYVTNSANNGSGSITNEYNDTTTDDGTGVTSFVINGAVGGINLEFIFDNVALPYSDANAFFIEFSGIRVAVATIQLQIKRNDDAWQNVNGTAMTQTADRTDYFAYVPSGSDTVSSFISTNGSPNQTRIRLYDTSATSGSITVDYLRLTIGSIAPNSGSYATSITRGSTSSGGASSIQTLDTSAAVDSWVLNTAAAYASTELPGDCTAAANHCAAATAAFPVTVPTNSVVTGLIVATRFNTSSTALDMRFSVVNTARLNDSVLGNQDIATSDNITAVTMGIVEVNSPTKAVVGFTAIAPSATYGLTPMRLVDTLNNKVILRARSTGADTTARTFTWDFVFVSIKTVTPEKPMQYSWTATGGTLGLNMTETNSNYRHTQGNDGTSATTPTYSTSYGGYWHTTAGNPGGTDVYLSFGGVTIPQGANKMIVTSRSTWSVASTPYSMYLYDWEFGDWMNVTPHASASATFAHSGTVGNYDIIQLEVFNGYFPTSNAASIYTPMDHFVSRDANKEVRLRVVNSSTTANFGWDFAQIQFVIDPRYFPSSLTVQTGSISSNRYSDVFTDDATNNLVLAPSSNTVDARFNFTNVATPPEGFNAALFQISAFKTTAGTYNLYLYNYTSGQFETVATGVTRTADATDYFLKGNIGDWRSYISGGNMVVQLTSTGNANNLNIDYVNMTLGTVPNGGTPLTVDYGAQTLGTGASLNNMDSYNSANDLDGTQYLTVVTAHANSGIKAFDELGGKAFEVNLPFHVRPGTLPAGIIWFFRAQQGSATVSVGYSVADPGGNFRNFSTSSFFWPLTNLIGPTTNPNNAVYNTGTTSQTVTQGWYVDQLEDLWVMRTNRIPVRLWVQTGVVTESRLIVDTVFFSYRWVPTNTTPTVQQRMRGGKWWFAGTEQAATSSAFR